VYTSEFSLSRLCTAQCSNHGSFNRSSLSWYQQGEFVVNAQIMLWRLNHSRSRSARDHLSEDSKKSFQLKRERGEREISTSSCPGSLLSSSLRQQGRCLYRTWLQSCSCCRIRRRASWLAGGSRTICLWDSRWRRRGGQLVEGQRMSMRLRKLRLVLTTLWCEGCVE